MLLTASRRLIRSSTSLGKARTTVRFSSSSHVPNRPISSTILSELVNRVLRSALDETSASIGPHVGWIRGGVASQAALLQDPLNQTAEFNSIVKALRAGDVLWQWPAIASPFNFVFVGGIFSSYYPLAYVTSLRGLINQGIAATRLTGIDTKTSVEINGAVLVNELKNAIVQHPTKKLIIMAHSKGSLDVLEAVRLEPSLAPHIHRLVSFQSPFGGSPYAGAYLQSNSYYKNLIDGMTIRFLTGDYSGVKSLTYEARREWFERNPVSELKIPVLCFASSTLPRGLLFEDLGAYMQQSFGVPNDGLVAQLDAILPGSPFVLCDGMSHAAPVLNDRVNCLVRPSVAFEALAYMACQDPSKKSGAL